MAETELVAIEILRTEAYNKALEDAVKCCWKEADRREKQASGADNITQRQRWAAGRIQSELLARMINDLKKPTPTNRGAMSPEGETP